MRQVCLFAPLFSQRFLYIKLALLAFYGVNLSILGLYSFIHIKSVMEYLFGYLESSYRGNMTLLILKAAFSIGF